MGRIPQLSAGLAALAALALLPAAASEARINFRSGVAAGEVNAHSAKIWTRATEAGNVRAQVAEDRKFDQIVERVDLQALPENDFTVQTTVAGLGAGDKYHYRFCAAGRCSDRGKVKTAPSASQERKIRFAFSGDTDATAEPSSDTPFHGGFRVLRSMRREHNNFNVHLGDTIYSDSGVAGATDALTTEEKWAKYKLNLEQPPMVALRRATGLYSHWDDHEFINDFSIPEHGQTLYEDGVKAFTDYAPVSFSDTEGLYRTFRWGRNLELFFLDERSFRDAKVSATDVCDNPDTGGPDLAPTAPQTTRDLFSLLIPSLSQPISQACKDAINDPTRIFLGQAQFDAFLADVESSNAKWKVVMNETPIQQFYGLPYDRWEGYAYERVELLNELQSRDISNLVFLTTDTHADFANVVRERTLTGDVAPTNAPGASPADTPYRDFVAGPVATNTFWAEIDQVTGGSGNGETLSNAFFRTAPPIGVGMLCSQGDEDSYAEVTVTADRLKVNYRDADGGPVTDVDASQCGPYILER
ncbi:MAG: alkaline phosphatase D family protein [bacterium]